MDAPEHRLPPGTAGIPSGFVAPPVGTGADKVNVGRLVQTLWRQKWLILGLTAVLWLPAVLLINAMTPLYSASAVVVIDPHTNRVINIPSVSEPMGMYLDTVNTEVEILRSRDLARVGVLLDRVGRLARFRDATGLVPRFRRASEQGLRIPLRLGKLRERGRLRQQRRQRKAVRDRVRRIGR